MTERKKPQAKVSPATLERIEADALKYTDDTNANHEICMAKDLVALVAEVRRLRTLAWDAYRDGWVDHEKWLTSSKRAPFSSYEEVQPYWLNSEARHRLEETKDFKLLEGVPDGGVRPTPPWDDTIF